MIVSGYPCSGKTKYALELVDYFKKLGKETIYISFETENIDRKKSFASILLIIRKIAKQSEQELRAKLKTAVFRNLRADNVVIFESLCYIKGYRYELFCDARSVRSTYALIYVHCTKENSIKYNSERIDGYSDREYLLLFIIAFWS